MTNRLSVGKLIGRNIVAVALGAASLVAIALVPGHASVIPAGHSWPGARPATHAAVSIAPKPNATPNVTPNPNGYCPATYPNQVTTLTAYQGHLDFGGQSNMGGCSFELGKFWIGDSTTNPTTYTVFQDDGNLVMYYKSPDGAWHVGGQTHTYGSGLAKGCRLNLQPDGNAVIYRCYDLYPMWQSGTAPCNSNPATCWMATIYSGVITNGHQRFGGIVGVWKQSNSTWYIQWKVIIGQSP